MNNKEYWKEKRLNMVENQLKSRGIKDINVLKIMSEVPREEFVPGQTLIVGAYTGRLVRIGVTKARLDTNDGQISLPNIVLLEEVVRLKPGDEFTQAEDRRTPENSPEEASQ